MVLKKFSFWKKREEEEKPQGHRGMNERERLIDLFIHDLASPLSIISTSVSNLLHKTERYGPISDHQRRLLERISRNNRKAQILLNEMIEIARSKEGFFRTESFEIEKMIQNSLSDALESVFPGEMEKLFNVERFEEFKNLLESQGIFIEIIGRYCRHPFCHDQKKIQQILRNLMSNALKYRRRKVDILISGEDDLQILVKDDGPGIAPEDQEAIFQRFVRLNDKRNGVIPGLGLGLAGVKTLVEAMGGEITLESNEGIETRFIVRIPPLT